MGVEIIKVVIILGGVGLAIYALVKFQRREAAASAMRMLRMMRWVGVDPGFALAVDRRTGRLSRAMRRCVDCPQPQLCDKWLAGEVAGENHFCPNAETFRGLAKLQDGAVKGYRSLPH